jgi:hypothetical protein
VNSKTIEAITGLLNALRLLIHEMGVWPFCTVVIGTVGGMVGFSMWRDRRRALHALLIVEHKEKEIERLAEDNRRYREVYLLKMGVPQDVLRQDSLDSESANQERKQLREAK